MEYTAVNLKKNCFDVLRLVAAFQGMPGHLIEHYELDRSSELFRVLAKLICYIPGKGVVIFFAISGFFALQSVERSNVRGGVFISRRNFCVFIQNFGLPLP